MARRPRVFAPGLLYHVIVRGNQRQKTFVGERDYQSYLERLGKYRRKFDVALYAYCLMPNHIHLLLETSSQPLSKFMQGLQQSYTADPSKDSLLLNRASRESTVKSQERI